MAASSSERLRRRLVRELEVESDAVRAAFLAVPRERFLPEVAEREGLEAVYRNDAIVTKSAPNGMPLSSSSAPSVMAPMLERLELEPGMRVLEIGAGTGYNAALLAELVGPGVTTIDVDVELARKARASLRSGGHRVRVVAGDGRDGHAAGAPYDRIVVTASADTIPRAWFDQLRDGGLLEVPLRLESGHQLIPTFRRDGDRLSTVGVLPGGFMPLRSAEGDGRPPGMPPCITASDGPRGAFHHQVSGAAIAKLSTTAKRRLLVAVLGPARRRPLGLRADSDALVLYLSLTLPAARAVTVVPGWASGLITRDGRSLAYVERKPGSVSSLTVHGDDRAADELLAAVGAWAARGRPGREQLRVTVDFDGGQPRLRRSWAAQTKP